MSADTNWVTESWENMETRYRIKSVLFEKKTEFQHMQLVDSHQFGKMLILDGIVQTTEKDEFYYHEMMTHVPILAHPNPSRVLIIGGGDGGILREVLKHPGVQKATLVEIDPSVVEFSNKYLPGISKGAFGEPRAELVFADGSDFIKETQNKYDIVIVDSPDPIGPAQVLFGKTFYSNLHQVMNPGAIMVRQTGSLHLQPAEQMQAYKILQNIFTYSAFYVYPVPTYVGGLFSSVFCSDGIQPETFNYESLDRKYADTPLNTKYYNPGIHRGAFHIPSFFKDNLK